MGQKVTGIDARGTDENHGKIAGATAVEIETGTDAAAGTRTAAAAAMTATGTETADITQNIATVGIDRTVDMPETGRPAKTAPAGAAAGRRAAADSTTSGPAAIPAAEGTAAGRPPHPSAARLMNQNGT